MVFYILSVSVLISGSDQQIALLAARTVTIIYSERDKNRNTALKYKLFIHNRCKMLSFFFSDGFPSLFGVARELLSATCEY